MKQYSKPMISIDAGMAEGVYAASGAGSSGSVTFNFSRYDGDWGTGGTAIYTFNLSDIKRENLLLTVSFNLPISGAWGASSSASVSGKTATFSWANQTAPSSGELSIQVQGNDIKQLTIEGYTYSNN